MTKIICYIDGFNFYHSLKDLEHKGKINNKYINLWSLIEDYKKDSETIEAIKYFSAYATWKPTSYRQHQKYVAKLKNSGVTPILSHFKKKHPSCKSCGATWDSHEEKETDVRIALEMFKDAMHGNVDRIYLISADSDLVAPVRMIKEQFPKIQILILTPPKRHNHARDLRNIAHHSIAMNLNRIKKHRFSSL